MMSLEARFAIQYEDCAKAGAVSRENARRVSFFMVAEPELESSGVDPQE